MEIKVPQGFRDSTVDECNRKQKLQNQVQKLFKSFGYEQISTPMVEYYSTYDQAFEDAESDSFFQFFDPNGKTLTLRSDMTVPIARVCATKYANARPPFRFSYCADVFKVRHIFGGKRSQVTDCGIELIGLDEKSDVEVLYLAMQVLEQLHCENYQLEIGHSGFFRKACEVLQISESDTKKLADYIDRKSVVDLQDYIKTLSIDEQARQFFQALPLLSGKQDALVYAKQIAFHEDLKKEIEKLENLYEDLGKLGISQHVSFDLGKIPHLDYYTGIIFEGYVNRVATSVLSGGRYDLLLAKFGRPLPACGFSVKLDYLIDVIPSEGARKVKLMYPRGKEVEALLYANSLRFNEDVEMIPWDQDQMEVVR